MTIEEKIFIKELLSIDGSVGKHENRFSCFSFALKSARYNIGRNIETGEYADGNINISTFNQGLYYSQMFTGITMYLILLEQIGTLVRKKGINFRNGIKVALESFASPSLSKDEIESLTLLRHSLAHNFGLANEKKYGYRGQKFSLSFDNKAPLIKIPDSKWSGNYSDKSDDSFTEIGIYAFTSLVEEIIDSCIASVNKDNVELLIKVNEIKARFTIIV